MRERFLERAVVGKGGGGDDEEVEETERGEPDEGRQRRLFDEEEMAGKGVADEEKSSLEHKGQTLHNEIEMPGNHPVHLSLSMAAAINNGSAQFDLGVTVEPWRA